MTVDDMVSKIESCLLESGSVKLPEMRSDFRKMQVIFLCTANGNKSLCKAYLPSPTGGCAFHCDGTCVRDGVLPDA
jgi:hypothetical protein